MYRVTICYIPIIGNNYVHRHSADSNGSTSFLALQAFGKNGRTTIRTKNRKFQNRIGKSTDLSFLDIKLVNLMYQCGGKYTEIKKSQNGSPMQRGRKLSHHRHCSDVHGLDMVPYRQIDGIIYELISLSEAMFYSLLFNGYLCD